MPWKNVDRVTQAKLNSSLSLVRQIHVPPTKAGCIETPSPVGNASVVILIRTDTALSPAKRSKKAESVSEENPKIVSAQCATCIFLSEELSKVLALKQ